MAARKALWVWGVLLASYGLGLAAQGRFLRTPG